jgi:catechol 2,3-dioxygenase-like lactoylglutathione lyase family enzyme
MSTAEVRSDDVSGIASAGNADMKLEVVVIPVSDAGRAKEFYGSLGWRLDADRAAGDDFRLIQFTPPGSGTRAVAACAGEMVNIRTVSLAGMTPRASRITAVALHADMPGVVSRPSPCAPD